TARIVPIDGVVGIADRRPQHPAVSFDLFDDYGVSIVGDRQEAPELLFRIVDKDRSQQLAFVADEDRSVVGDELCEERNEKQDQEEPEAPIPAFVGFEVLPTTDVDWRWLQPSRDRREQGE